MPNDIAKKKLTELVVDGYTFQADIDLIDDVETLETIEDIEGGKVSQIITLVKKVVGEQGYEDMKAHFTEKNGRMQISVLNKVFEVIFEKFDPKG